MLGRERVPAKEQKLPLSSQNGTYDTENWDDSFPRTFVRTFRRALSRIFSNREQPHRWIFRNCSCSQARQSLRIERWYIRALLWPLTLPFHTFSAYKSAALKMSHWRKKSDESISFKPLPHDAILSVFILDVEITSMQGHVVKDKLPPTLSAFIKDENSVVR